LLLLVASAGCDHHRAANDDTPTPTLGPPSKPYLLHLPGIGGIRRIDRMLTEGLVQGGIDADVEIHDWTGSDEGMNALYAHQRHQREAEIVAQKITEKFRADPRRKIILSGHSGGTGIAVWALEKLPDDVKVDSLLLLASALSPGYDLSPALRHVRGKAYVLYSALDPVLGVGTRMFGTIDGVKSDAGGRVGFKKPKDAVDPKQYDKLVQIAYHPTWIRLNNIGDHIGAMMRPFAREILSPLLQTGVLREIAKAATRPVTRSATTQSAHSEDAQALKPGLHKAREVAR
jgi:pimeloyl-ACP methyl ester carboxylesterase